jgi:hypothetical protein
VAHELTLLLQDSPRRALLQRRFHALRTELGGNNTGAEVATVVLRYVVAPKERAHA